MSEPVTLGDVLLAVTLKLERGRDAGQASLREWRDVLTAHLAQPAQAVDVERVLTALGHVRVPNTRCTARVAETPAKDRPPGPHNPPMWCFLPEGHEGQHRHNGGGMYPSIPFRDTYEVVMVPLPDYCEKCNRVWPCDDAKAIISALSDEKAGPVDDAKDAERYRRFRAALLNKPGDMEAFYMKAVADTEAEFDAAVDATLPASPTPDKEG